ncbi:hypothetical protein D3C85_1102540 [compost metagenome]
MVDVFYPVFGVLNYVRFGKRRFTFRVVIFTLNRIRHGGTRLLMKPHFKCFEKTLYSRPCIRRVRRAAVKNNIQAVQEVADDGIGKFRTIVTVQMDGFTSATLFPRYCLQRLL